MFPIMYESAMEVQEILESIWDIRETLRLYVLLIYIWLFLPQDVKHAS